MQKEINTAAEANQLLDEKRNEYCAAILIAQGIGAKLLAEADSIQANILLGVNQVASTSQVNITPTAPPEPEPQVTITRTPPVREARNKRVTARYLIDMFMKNGMTTTELSTAIAEGGYKKLGICNIYATLKALGWVANKDQGGVGPFPYHKK